MNKNKVCFKLEARNLLEIDRHTDNLRGSNLKQLNCSERDRMIKKDTKHVHVQYLLND